MAHLTNFSFEFFYKIFTEDASQPLLYHVCKKVKNDQKLKSRGPALKQCNHGNNIYKAAELTCHAYFCRNDKIVICLDHDLVLR